MPRHPSPPRFDNTSRRSALKKLSLAALAGTAAVGAGWPLRLRAAPADARSPSNPPVAQHGAEAPPRLITIGGGITDPEKAYRNCKAGADVIVVGNAIEKDPSLLEEIAAAVHGVSMVK